MPGLLAFCVEVGAAQQRLLDGDGRAFLLLRPEVQSAL